MNIQRLFQILQEVTVQIYVRGQRDNDPCIISSTKVDLEFSVSIGYNPPDGDVACVDCHFVKVWINKDKATLHRPEFEELMRSYLERLDVENDISFFSVGDDIGSRRAALLALALGHALELWEKVIPEDDGFDEDAHHRAGLGYVMFRRKSAPPVLVLSR